MSNGEGLATNERTRLAPRPTPSLLSQVGRNICHGSDSIENADKEIALWFGESEIVDSESAMKDWIYE